MGMYRRIYSQTQQQDKISSIKIKPKIAMKNITLRVVKSEVWEYVKKNAAYFGKKNGEGADFTKVMLTDADEEAWPEFFSESCAKVTGAIKELIVSPWAEDKEKTGSYNLGLSISESYDETLTSGVEHDLLSFISNDMVAQWYKVANKEESKEFEDKATASLGEALRKLYYRKRPTRPARRIAK